jgi:rhamnose utilization protein RhaD (predicted bifunctional aldolase and dehydrogenase)
MSDASQPTLDFVALSRFAGSRFDLVQAGGGNASIKLDGTRMLVKSSGVLLSEVGERKGYVTVDYPALLAVLDDRTSWQHEERRARDAAVTELVRQVTTPPGSRASIEVFLHALLGRFVLHTHPIAVVALASREDWRSTLVSTWPESLLVPYRSPGIDLGLEVASHVRDFTSDREHPPAVVFLQNHGLVVSAQAAGEVREITEVVVKRCEEIAGLDVERYRAATSIVEYLGGSSGAYLCEDRIITDLLASRPSLFKRRPFFPDGFVFCGVVPLIVDTLDDIAALQAFRAAYRDTPKVVIHGGRIFFVAATTKKAREVEEVFKAHLLALASRQPGQVQFLDDVELAYLGDWEAEKYRKDL